jgi:hypothetical protein
LPGPGVPAPSSPVGNPRPPHTETASPAAESIWLVTQGPGVRGPRRPDRRGVPDTDGGTADPRAGRVRPGRPGTGRPSDHRPRLPAHRRRAAEAAMNTGPSAHRIPPSIDAPDRPREVTRRSHLRVSRSGFSDGRDPCQNGGRKHLAKSPVKPQADRRILLVAAPPAVRRDCPDFGDFGALLRSLSQVSAHLPVAVEGSFTMCRPLLPSTELRIKCLGHGDMSSTAWPADGSVDIGPARGWRSRGRDWGGR